MDTIGMRMKQIREQNHLSQTEVAELSGFSQANIAKAETGRINPSLKMLTWWADYFDISLDYLFCRTDKPEGKLYEYKPKFKADEKDMKQFIEMCFDPKSPYNSKLKETILNMLGDSDK